MTVKAPKKIKEMDIEAVQRRIKKMLDARETYMKNINNHHVRLMKGNAKTGVSCWTVSLIPIVDCPNCSGCKGLCYDIRNDCIYPSVIESRALNSAIHKLDQARFWREISDQIRENFVTELRINVGGDLNDKDFEYLAVVAAINPATDILFFTKNYDGINKYLDTYSFPENVHPILSVWKGMKIDNRHNLPESHLLYADGSTTAPEFGAKLCTGNCSECHFHKVNGNDDKSGCWGLKKGEHVVFPAH